MYACQNGDIEILKLFSTISSKEGIFINIYLTNIFGDNVFTITALYNHTEIMKLLLKHPYKINHQSFLLHKNNFGYSALDYAKMNNNLEMIELIEKEIQTHSSD